MVMFLDCGRRLDDTHTQKMWRVHLEIARTGNLTHNQKTRAAPKHKPAGGLYFSVAFEKVTCFCASAGG